MSRNGEQQTRQLQHHRIVICGRSRRIQQALTKPAPSKMPRTTPAMKQAGLNLDSSLGSEMNVFVSGRLSQMRSAQAKARGQHTRYQRGQGLETVYVNSDASFCLQNAHSGDAASLLTSR